VIIGKIFSPAVLGNYTRALQFEQLPENTTNSIIVKVLFPILTKNKDNLQQLKVNTLQIISWLSFIVTPIMVMLMIFSKQIISLLLTDAWLSSSDFLIIVSFSGLFIPINNSILNIFNVLGKPIITVWVYFFKIIFSLIAIFSLWKLGPLYVVSVMIIENVLVFFILSYFTNDLIGLKFIEIIKSMFSAFAINTIIAILVLLISQISIIGSLSSLLYIIVISFIYAILLILLNLLTNSLQGQELKKQLNKYFK
jgi:O-antigen/teichoic acid export membrane protein